MNRGSSEWKYFVEKQEREINRRLNKYNNIDTVKDQLNETGNLSGYQSYKISTVSVFLKRALQKIKNGTYGVCDVCKEEINIERLKMVPGALTCVKCDDLKEAK